MNVPFNADSTRTHVDTPGRRAYRHAWAIAAMAIYLWYLGYRGLYTINPQALVFSLSVYLAEVHGFVSLVFYYFQIWTIRARTVVPLTRKVTVDVFITTYNEEVDLLRQTVRAAINMRYPHKTFVLDDGRRPAVRALCEELGCEYLTRPDNAHAKAGNWNHAYARTSGEVIATFDADHVPRADFLERTLGFFDDAQVALVQVPQRYHNLDSLQHRVSWRDRRLYGEQDVFFNIVMPGKDHWNATFFCGTGAVLRRSALEPSGGLQIGTITEDMHTALAMQANGWKTVYLNELLVTGLAPMDFASYSSQRLRWAEGNLAIIRHINPLTCRGLTLSQRLCYFASMWHWTTGFPKLAFYLAPPMILFTGQFPIANFDRQFLWVYGVHILSLVVSYKVLSRGSGRLLMDELFNMANCFTLIAAIKRFVFGRGEGTFVVTSKRGGVGGDGRSVLPHAALIAVSVMGLVWSGLGIGFGVTDDVIGALIATAWAIYNMTLAVVVLGFALRPMQKRDAVRFRTAVPVEVFGERAAEGIGVTADVSQTGCTLLWPRTIPEGTRLQLRLHFGSQYITCAGQVVAIRSKGTGNWVSHGVRFVDMDLRTVDRLADSIYNMAVPEIFTRLSQPSMVTRWRIAMSGWINRGARAARREVYLPVRVSAGAGDFLAPTGFVAVTRDISSSGLGLIVPRPLEVGTEVRVRLVSGDKEWDHVATVVRVVPMPSARADLATYFVGLRIEPDQASALDSLIVEEAA